MSNAHSLLARIRPGGKTSTITVGRKFGRLIVLGLSFRVRLTSKSRPHVLCECECGKIVAILCQSLAGGITISCGCFKRERASETKTRHGYARHGAIHPLFNILKGMIQRCHAPSHAAYCNYGARGIYVSDEWRRDRGAFIRWALAHGWRRDLQIDRINNDGPYSPENCRFVGRKQNMRNSRNVRMLSAFGEIKSIVEWTEDARCKVSYGTFSTRIHRDWKTEDAICIPVT